MNEKNYTQVSSDNKYVFLWNKIFLNNCYVTVKRAEWYVLSDKLKTSVINDNDLSEFQMLYIK